MTNSQEPPQPADSSGSTTTQNSSVLDWTSALAQSNGALGGGAGSGVMLAIAASLISMVCGYTSTEEKGKQQILTLMDSKAKDLKREALRLADEDAEASAAFGAAFRKDPGPDREEAIAHASTGAAKASAALGELAIPAIADLKWLAAHGNPALIADVAVALGALRAAVTGARTNVSFDLSKLATGGTDLRQVRSEHTRLWEMVEALTAARDEIDEISADIDHRAAPTDAG
ncbi:cyclodeaminase/cyclohydrolase family protein [Glutamicibacter arilaitensis]|uniref:cyclodeaminase/cyclohydrolase family protein n=1 Tax=Glutamicibacter arilaitensis TaxID=256701 RepID=UPI0038512462